MLGGDSSLALAFRDLAVRRGFRVLSTSRRSKVGVSDSVFSLDVSNLQSVNDFLADINRVRVGAVFCFLGSPYKVSMTMQDYLSVHLVNTFYLLEQLVLRSEHLGMTTLLYVSSRAARFPSRDAPYAIAKGGLTAGVQSLSRLVPHGTVVASVVPGLILGSTMSEDMGAELREEHQRRSGGKLLDMEGFAVELLELFLDLGPDHNGTAITLGPEYP